jgi:hypothetical protein
MAEEPEDSTDAVMQSILTEAGGEEALTALLKAGGGYEAMMALHSLFNGGGEDAVEQLVSQPGGQVALEALLATPASPRGRQPVAGRGKRNTAQINREKEAERINRENGMIASRLIENSKPSLTVNTTFDDLRQRAHSCAVNRQREGSRIARENQRLAHRLAKPTRVALAPNAKPKPKASAARTGSVPTGWSRGVGGRLLPPPKQRWGNRPTYDAGEMQF